MTCPNLAVVEFRGIERAAGAFQEPVSADAIVAMARRAFGVTTTVVAALELGGGSYNTTYRVDIAGMGPVILRIAPPPHRQARIERWFLRNEHVALPYLAALGALLPRTLGVDWTHDIVGRDYVWQSVLAGLPAVHHLHDYPRATWPALYRQFGALARQVHDVRGERFGPVIGPTFDTWRAAVLSALENTVADVVDAGLPVDDVKQVLALADDPVFDEITEPRLLHGDLWVTNVMLLPGTGEPVITGVFDHDRASWGDPMADWTIHMVRERADRAAFWDTYGMPATSDNAERRQLIHRAMHLGATRIEQHRHGRDLTENYAGMRDVLTRLS